MINLIQPITVQQAPGVPRGRGCAQGVGAPPPLWTGCGPPGLDSFASIFYIFQKYSSLIFMSFRELLFLHKNNTMAILLKTTSVRVSSIQIMQVRVQNKGKSVWKSRYDGDVSTVFGHFLPKGHVMPANLYQSDKILRARNTQARSSCYSPPRWAANLF